MLNLSGNNDADKSTGGHQKVTQSSLHFVEPSGGAYGVPSSATFASDASTVAGYGLGTTSNSGDANLSPDSSAVNAFTPSFLKTARHPMICIFHLLFKALALLSFMFGSLFFGGWEGDYVFSFVTTTIFFSMDFWTVKNITGRLLVGMRWWNNIKSDGSSEWVYESHTDETSINATDKAVFWIALYCWPLCWAVFLVIYLLRLEIEWVLLVAVGLALSAANLIGYWRCSKEAKKRVQQWASNTALRAIVGRFF